jgi:hypothetical protein
MNAVLNDAKANGYEIGGITLTTSFLQGGIFSADGIHPSNLGYAITADEFILAINAAKGTAIPEPNFSTIFFTPHVPVVPTPSRTSGPFGFPADAGFRLLEMFPPVDGETAILPPEGLPERSPRVVRGRN